MTDQIPTHAFLSADALRKIADEVVTTENGLVHVYDVPTQSLATVCCKNSVVISWSVFGPMDADQAHQEIRANEKRAGIRPVWQ